MFRTIMFGAMACIVTACVLAGAAEAQPMSPATFRDEIARRISQAWEGLCFEKPDEYTLRVGRSQDNCAEIILSTANVYRKYENDKEHSPLFADNLVDVALRGLESLERGAVTPSREKLVAVVRPKEFVAAY